jgi:hypothetical protein
MTCGSGKYLNPTLWKLLKYELELMHLLKILTMISKPCGNDETREEMLFDYSFSAA